MSDEPYETPDGDLFWMITQLRSLGGWQRQYADALWREIHRLSASLRSVTRPEPDLHHCTCGRHRDNQCDFCRGSFTQ